MHIFHIKNSTDKNSVLAKPRHLFSASVNAERAGALQKHKVVQLSRFQGRMRQIQ